MTELTAPPTEQVIAPSRGSAALLLTASGAAFLAVLDTTVTNLVVPALHEDFPGRSVSDLSWVVIAYFALFSALLASAGRLADVFGRRSVFLSGVTIFTVMSLVCAVAPNLPVLIAARAGQGVGAAAMIPAALAILLLDGPPERRAGAVALWSAAAAAAAAVGPGIGGILVDALGWRSVFYINVPLGVLILVVAARILPRQARTASRRLPDPLGTVLLAGGVGAVTLGLSKGTEWGWSSPATLGCLIGGLLAVTLAIWRATRTPVPAIETELWRNRTFLVTNVVSFLFGMALYAWMLGSVLLLTGAWLYGESRAGFAVTPGALAASAAAMLAGRITGRFGGPRNATLFGLLAFLAGGVWIVAGLTADANYLTLVLPVSAVTGFGMGAIMYGTAMAAAMSAPPTRFAGASGMNTMARQVGGALGVAALAVTMDANAGHGIDGYRDVFLFCTVLVVVALVVTWAGLRLDAPAEPPKVDAS